MKLHAVALVLGVSVALAAAGLARTGVVAALQQAPDATERVPPPAAPAATAVFRADPAHTGAYASQPIPALAGRLWQLRTGDAVRSSPVIDNGSVYVGSDDGRVYAVDLGTGAIRWRFKTGGAVRATPAAAGGIVYAASRDD